VSQKFVFSIAAAIFLHRSLSVATRGAKLP
jgi:hypothetical protein